jgi:hypothetical protein
MPEARLMHPLAQGAMIRPYRRTTLRLELSASTDDSGCARRSIESAGRRHRDAAIVITGIELAQKLRKGQFKIHRLLKRAPGDVHDLWMAVLVA